jgi:hypothetical protein
MRFIACRQVAAHLLMFICTQLPHSRFVRTRFYPPLFVRVTNSTCCKSNPCPPFVLSCLRTVLSVVGSFFCGPLPKLFREIGIKLMAGIASTGISLLGYFARELVTLTRRNV